MKREFVLDIIAKNLRMLMNEANITVTELARRSGVSQGTISKITTSAISVTLPTALAICEGLKVDFAELMQGLLQQENTIKRTYKNNALSQQARLKIGILSINNRRLTYIKNAENDFIGASELEKGLDLAETSSHLLQLIQESVQAALPKEFDISSDFIKQAQLNLVMQSYEFEDTRQKFIHFVKRHFKDVFLLSDWQLTYLSTFEKSQGISLTTDKGVSLSYRHNKSIKKIGGWKFPVYDLGGENWLGVETIRHTIEAAEGYISMSNLAQNVLAKFGGNIQTITELCFKGSKDADVFCLFAAPLIRAYLTNDPDAKKIIDNGFYYIQRSISRVDDIVGKKNNIAIQGSLTDIYKPMIEADRLINMSNNSVKAEFLANIDEAYLVKNGVPI